MSHLRSGSAASDVLGAAAPSNPQAAAAIALPMSASFSAISVAATAAAAEAAAATGAFLAEIDVVVECGVETIGVGLHVFTRQYFALPWFHTQVCASRDSQADERAQQAR